jgi:hypothetical protein
MLEYYLVGLAKLAKVTRRYICVVGFLDKSFPRQTINVMCMLIVLFNVSLSKNLQVCIRRMDTHCTKATRENGRTTARGSKIKPLIYSGPYSFWVSYLILLLL